MRIFSDAAKDVVLIGAEPQQDRIAALIIWFDRGIVGETRQISCGNQTFTVELPKVAIGQGSTKLFLQKHLYYA